MQNILGFTSVCRCLGYLSDAKQASTIRIRIGICSVCICGSQTFIHVIRLYFWLLVKKPLVRFERSDPELKGSTLGQYGWSLLPPPPPVQAGEESQLV